MKSELKKKVRDHIKFLKQFENKKVDCMFAYDFVDNVQMAIYETRELLKKVLKDK